jgi:hypothetical protein
MKGAALTLALTEYAFPQLPPINAMTRRIPARMMLPNHLILDVANIFPPYIFESHYVLFFGKTIHFHFMSVLQSRGC